MSDEMNASRELPAAARQRIERWLTSPGLRAHLEQSLDTGRRPLRTGPYIAVSREAGTGGGEIARMLARRLGWDLLDKELLDFMAECYGMPRQMLEFVDETGGGWLQDLFSSWLDAKAVSHEKFVVYLERIMFLAAMYGRIIFVGRGAQCILPRNSGLGVRLIAPLEFRIARRMNRRGITRKEALKQIEKTDADRNAFYRQYFHYDADDAHCFDVTVNVGRYSQEAVCELIIEAFERIERENSTSVDID